MRFAYNYWLELDARGEASYLVLELLDLCGELLGLVIERQLHLVLAQVLGELVHLHTAPAARALTLTAACPAPTSAAALHCCTALSARRGAYLDHLLGGEAHKADALLGHLPHKQLKIGKGDRLDHRCSQWTVSVGV